MFVVDEREERSKAYQLLVFLVDVLRLRGGWASLSHQREADR
jgi:hypothetical protein